MVTTAPALGPTGEPIPPDPQAGPVREGDGPQPDPTEEVEFEEAEATEPDTSLADPDVKPEED